MDGLSGIVMHGWGNQMSRGTLPVVSLVKSVLSPRTYEEVYGLWPVSSVSVGLLCGLTCLLFALHRVSLDLLSHICITRNYVPYVTLRPESRDYA